MTKPTIVTRAGKGSALTFTEGDANFTNLKDATVTIRAGGAGTDVVSDLNGTIILVAGTNVSLSGNNTSKEITINATSSGITDVVNDTTPQLGGNLDVNGNSIVSASNGNIAITPNGTGRVVITGSVSVSGDITAPVGGGADLTLSGDGTGNVNLNSDTVRIGDNNTDATITTHGTGDLILNTNAGTSSGVIRINDGANGNIAITPDGTGSIVLDGLNWPQADGTANYVLKTNGTGQLSWTAQSAGGIANVVEDTTPQLGGDLDLNDFNIIDTGATPLLITSNTDKNIAIRSQGTGDVILLPLGTGKVTIDGLNWPTSDGTSNQYLKTDGAGNLSWATSSGGITDVVNDTTPQLGGHLDVNGKDIVSVSNGNINILPDGTGRIQLDQNFWPTADGAANSFLTTDAYGQLSYTNTVKGYNEGSIYDLGTTGGTVAPNCANGNVQKITLSSALTINAFTSPVAGQSLTLIIYGGTSYTSITSTMKFAGGIKTLTATAGCIDILTVYYDGTNYFASLGKGFA